MRPEVWISLGVTVVVAGILILLIYETVRLRRYQEPITPVVRRLILRFPGWSIGVGGIVIFAVGACFGHFFWDVGCLYP